MTERTYTNRRYLDAVNDHVVIFDGAMGTSILKYDLTAADYGGEQYAGCVDYLVITRPDVIEAIHTSFLNVGSEAIETCTFRSNRLTLISDRSGDIKWTCVLILALLTQFSIALVHFERRAAQAAALTVFTAAAIVALSLIAVQEDPFSGPLRIEPTPLEGVFKVIGDA